MDYSIYNPIEYFTDHQDSFEQIPWDNGQLRYGNQCEAMLYAFGITSFDEARAIMGYEGYGQTLYPQIGAQVQLKRIWDAKKRIPRCVIEIGGGRGEVSVGFAHLGISTVLVEPSKSVHELVKKTQEKFGVIQTPLIADTDLLSFVQNPGYSGYLLECDTIIFCEAIEHVSLEDFWASFPILKNTLRGGGLLIVVNWIDFWPVTCAPPYHCWEINDSVYDEISKEGKVIFRQGSHLVVRF